MDKPAAADNAQTRQIPVRNQDQTHAGSASDGHTRQIPAQRSARTDGTRPPQKEKSDGHSALEDLTSNSPAQTARTRQIPAQKAAETAEGDDLTKTRQVKTPPADAAPSDKDDSDMNVAAADHSDAKKKKRSHLTRDEDTTGGNTIVSIIKAVVYIVSVLVVSIGTSLFIILVGNDVYAFVKSEDVVEVTVPEGADIDDIASILSDSGIIKYPKIFKWYAGHNNDDGKFIAGKYSVASNLDYEDLLASFKEQIDEGTTWVTIPEGYTTDEIIALMVENGIGTKEGYIDAINNYPFDYWFVHEIDGTDWQSSGRFYRLDGYLFPDTYEFYNKSSERAVIEKLLARFSVIYGKKYREAAETMGMTTDEIVTIASMIEKEAGKAADYHLVSSVFHNRLKSEWYPKLESDATALYAIHHDTGERPTDVTGEHMEYETPYNTYLYDGLPPGPIANPSASSLNAALTPEETGYYYFVSYGVETYFSRTKEEHDGYIAMIKQMIAAANAAPQE